jgi:hypothetical protein
MSLDLGLSSGHGGFIAFKPQSRNWQTSQDGEKSVVDWNHAIWHLGEARTGWSRWPEGEAREWIWDSEIGVASPEPLGEKWERGFEVSLQILGPDDEPATDTLIYNATGVGAKLGFQALYLEYEEQVADNPGQVPVVKNDGVTPGKRTSIPNLTIDGWLDKPSNSSATRF